jgi:holo-[acyl-carrier protein] synthase
VSKVLGLGVRGVGWREIEIKRTPYGQPTVTLHGRAEQRRRALGLAEPLTVSISHIRDLAVAVAVGVR